MPESLRHPSGYLVYYDAERLTSASAQERPGLLRCIIDGILNKDAKAGNTAYCLGRDMVGIPERDEPGEVSFETDMSHGKLPPAMSLNLVRNINRLHGFISAIKRWPEQGAVIDVGCGTFPILALAAAIYHPRAEVRAIEINPESAESAEQLIRQFGFSERVQVINDDVSGYPIDVNTTAAVTETFNAALQEEPGPKIVQLLHRSGVPLITPSRAELCLRVVDNKFLQDIDLRSDTHASIPFRYRRNEVRIGNDWYTCADIYAAYYDDLGLVLPYDSDAISRGLSGRDRLKLNKLLENVDGRGQLVYELGSYPFEPRVGNRGLSRWVLSLV